MLWGANGLLRTFQCSLSHGSKFFNRNEFPILDKNVQDYKSSKEGTSVNHIFEKILKLKDLMMTETGKKETIKKHFTITFLKKYFYEENT